MYKKIAIISVMIFVVVLVLCKDLFTHEHEFGAWATIVEATEESEGLQKRKCRECGKVEEKVIAKVFHIHEYSEDWEMIKKPTCQEEGLVKYQCITCGEFIEEAFGDKEAHDYSEWVPVANPEEKFATKDMRKCKLCSHIDERDHEHEMSDWEIIEQPTCIKEGKLEATCQTCGYIENNVIPISENHKYESDWKFVEVGKEENTAIIENVCIVCNKTIRLEHTHNLPVVEVVKQATCTEEGLLVNKCTGCDYSVELPIPATGHTYGSAVVINPASCIANGLQERICEICDDILQEEIEMSKEFHKWGLWVEVKPATDTTPAVIERECELCHEKETKDNNVE